MNSGRPTLVLATDPDGARHVLATSVRSPQHRAGLADLAAGVGTGRGPLLETLLFATRLRDDDALCDVLAHLVPLRDRRGAAFAAIEDVDVAVRHLTASQRLPATLNGPRAQRYVLEESGAPAALDGRALLLANEHAPSGPWWSPIGEVPFEVRALGELLARVGSFGERARCTGRSLLDEHLSAWLTAHGAGLADPAGEFARAVVAALVMEPRGGTRNEAEPIRELSAAVEHDEDGCRVVVRRRESVGAPPFEWPCARWLEPAIFDLALARRDRLAPYWLLVFDGPQGHAPLLARTVSARRWLAAQDDLGARALPAREFVS